MLDGVSLDQIRAFITAVDEGSFSAAGRKLNRAQSAISDMIRGLEAQLDIELFDRDGRYPQLTEAGHALLSHAREIIGNVNELKSRARGISHGVEPELSVVIDVLFPICAIAHVASQFKQHFPLVPLRIFVEALGGTFLPLMNKTASIGIVGSLPMMPAGIMSEALSRVAFVAVASVDHPLAGYGGLIPKSELARHVQIVLTDRSNLSEGREFGVFSTKKWYLADLFAKHSFLLNGLGWGGMPLHTVQNDLRDGKLVELEIEDFPGAGFTMPMSAAYLADNPPGPAGRWFVKQLKIAAMEEARG